MDIYTRTSYDTARLFTRRYSTSFTLASRLFSDTIQPHIYAIYGVVRAADEIVDTYRGTDASAQLQTFSTEIYQALQAGFSANPLVHCFAQTARQYGITPDLIEPFFESMHTDLTATSFTKASYQRYIYGSAEVVGLMCLKVFTAGNAEQYSSLQAGARALGSAYQKVNFLRDMHADYTQLGRIYFPGVQYDQFTETQKQAIIADITTDFAVAHQALRQLPPGAKKAVSVSYRYYTELLYKLQHTSLSTLRTTRIRIPNRRKALLYAQARVGR